MYIVILLSWKMLKRGLDQILKAPFTILRNINTFIRFLWKKSLHIIARVLWSRFPKELNKPNKSWPQQWRFIVQMSIPFWIYFYGQSKTPCRQNWSISDLSAAFISSLLTRFIFWETAALIMPLSNIKICWRMLKTCSPCESFHSNVQQSGTNYRATIFDTLRNQANWRG